MRTIYHSAFHKPRLNRLHDKPADKASNNIIFVCKAHYYQCIIKETGINSKTGNCTYTPTAFSKDEILQKHASVLNTLNIPGHVDDDFELPYLYWIPYLQRYIAGSKNVLQNLCQ
jgi:hypothetical protein